MGSIFMMTNSGYLSKDTKEYIKNNVNKNTISSNTIGRYGRGIIAKFSEIKIFR